MHSQYLLMVLWELLGFFGEGLVLCPLRSIPAALLSSQGRICVQSSDSDGYEHCPIAILLKAAFSLFPLFTLKFVLGFFSI